MAGMSVSAHPMARTEARDGMAPILAPAHAERHHTDAERLPHGIRLALLAAMRLHGIVLGVTLCLAGCGGADESKVATSGASWARSAALAATEWHARTVPTKFAKQLLRRADDALAQTRATAAQLPDTGHAREIQAAIDSARATLPALDSAVAHARRGDVASPAAKLDAMASRLARFTPGGAAR
jgi:hypothetical protein